MKRTFFFLLLFPEAANATDGRPDAETAVKVVPREYFRKFLLLVFIVVSLIDDFYMIFFLLLRYAAELLYIDKRISNASQRCKLFTVQMSFLLTMYYFLYMLPVDHKMLSGEKSVFFSTMGQYKSTFIGQ